MAIPNTYAREIIKARPCPISFLPRIRLDSTGIIGKVLAKKYGELAATGWEPTRAEIERDVRDLFGGAFEQFLKS